MRLFFSVGEPSGDQHAGQLISELRQRVPELDVSGFGGPEMAQAGCRLHYRLTDLAVMGFFRVLPMIGKFYALLRRAKRILRDEQPDAVVLVDFPGFNWWIARQAKALGIPVFYYLPPQLWAWAPWRIKRVRKYVDHVICGLSFEQEWYTSRGVRAEYVGHPFFDEVANRRLDTLCPEPPLAADDRIIGLLPGSRHHEVAQNWPIMLQSIQQVARRHPGVRFLVACYSESHRTQCRSLLSRVENSDALRIDFFVGKTSEIIEVAECCLMVSGSVSLEMLARRTPAVVIYYFSRVSGWLARRLVHCRFASLPNLMADRKILPEFFPQGDGKEEARAAADQLSDWIDAPARLAQVRAELADLHLRVAVGGAIGRAADAILRPLQQSSSRRAA